jgi:hypothetical protein
VTLVVQVPRIGRRPEHNRDNQYCTSDDTVTSTDVAGLYGVTDAEDVAYGNNTLFVAGGVAPYIWSVRGQGFTFDGHVMRDAITDTPYIRVHAGPLACGYAPITVTDGCSTVEGSVDATVGVLHGTCSGVEFWGGQESVTYSRTFLGIGWDGSYGGCVVGYGFYAGIHPSTAYMVYAKRWNGSAWYQINGQYMPWENESLHAQMAAMPTKSINSSLSGKPARSTAPGCFECWWSCT